MNLIFLIDIIINFRTTYIHPLTGQEVVNLRKISLNYIKVRFWIDVLSTIPFDYIGLIMAGDSDSTGPFALISLLKLVRVLRLNRIISIMNIRDDIKLSLRFLKLIFFLILYLHVLACSWYYIVIIEKDWMPPLDYVFVSYRFYEESLTYKYAMGLYHSVLMFTGNDIGPRGTFQTMFVAFFIMLGAIITANIFGQLAVIMSNMNRKATRFQEKFDITATTMKNLNLPESLQVKIIGFIMYTQNFLESQNELKEFLKTISPSLREEVIQYIFSESLKNNEIVNYDENLLDYITKKLETNIHMPEDEIITQGEEPSGLFFIAKGECLVSVRDQNSNSQPVGTILPGYLFGEIALLFNSKRTASVKTANYATLAKLSKELFKDMCRNFLEVRDKLKERLKNYNDKLKLFLKFSMRQIPFMKNLSDKCIEEITYNLKQEYYEANDIIFRKGDSVEKIYLVTRGEINLLLDIDGKSFELHRLYQG